MGTSTADAARTIAAELGQSPDHAGTRRLAADLAQHTLEPQWVMDVRRSIDLIDIGTRHEHAATRAVVAEGGWEQGTARTQTPRPLPAPSACAGMYAITSAKHICRRLSTLATGYYILAQPISAVIHALSERMTVEPGAWRVSIDGPWLRISRDKDTRCKECGDNATASHLWRGASLCADCQIETWRHAGLCEKCGGDIRREATNRPDGTDDGGSSRQCVDCQWSPDE